MRGLDENHAALAMQTIARVAGERIEVVEQDIVVAGSIEVFGRGRYVQSMLTRRESVLYSAACSRMHW